jgi:hypothetical protein
VPEIQASTRSEGLVVPVVVLGSLCLLLPHPFEGPVILGLGQFGLHHHGIHLSDIFVVLLVGLFLEIRLLARRTPR